MRPYKPARSVEWALAELNRRAGTQFDPEVVRLLLELVRKDSKPCSDDWPRIAFPAPRSGSPSDGRARTARQKVDQLWLRPAFPPWSARCATRPEHGG